MALAIHQNKIKEHLEYTLGGYLSHAIRDRYGWRIYCQNNQNSILIDEMMMYEMVGPTGSVSEFNFSIRSHYPNIYSSSYFDGRFEMCYYDDTQKFSRISHMGDKYANDIPMTATQACYDEQMRINHNYGRYLQNIHSKYITSSYGTSVPMTPPPKQVDQKAKSAKLRKLFWHRFTKLGVNPVEQ